MFRAIVYVAGAAIFAALAWKFLAWQFVIQLALLAGMLLWTVVGGILVARHFGTRRQRNARHPLDRNSIAAVAVRATYAQKFGEDKAAQVDRTDPLFWTRIAEQRETTK